MFVKGTISKQARRNETGSENDVASVGKKPDDYDLQVHRKYLCKKLYNSMNQSE
jgi:hypothetical protein